LNKLQQFLTLPPNEHPRGSRRTASVFWYEMLFAVLIGLAWGIIGTVIGLVYPIPSILSLATYICYLYFGARKFRNDLWDRENA
jgi:ABC-type Mn2+/Zn2+ transport system permease subunit